MSMYDKSKFAFAETFNNADGKTSGSGFIGVIMGLTATLCFLIAMAGWWVGKDHVIDVIGSIIQLGFLSAALLGVRKIGGAIFDKKNPEKPEENPEDEVSKEGKTAENKPIIDKTPG